MDIDEYQRNLADQISKPQKPTPHICDLVGSVFLVDYDRSFFLVELESSDSLCNSIFIIFRQNLVDQRWDELDLGSVVAFSERKDALNRGFQAKIVDELIILGGPYVEKRNKSGY